MRGSRHSSKAVVHAPDPQSPPSPACQISCQPTDRKAEREALFLLSCPINFPPSECLKGVLRVGGKSKGFPVGHFVLRGFVLGIGPGKWDQSRRVRHAPKVHPASLQPRRSVLQASWILKLTLCSFAYLPGTISPLGDPSPSRSHMRWEVRGKRHLEWLPNSRGNWGRFRFRCVGIVVFGDIQVGCLVGMNHELGMKQKPARRLLYPH